MLRIFKSQKTGNSSFPFRDLLFTSSKRHADCFCPTPYIADAHRGQWELPRTLRTFPMLSWGAGNGMWTWSSFITCLDSPEDVTGNQWNLKVEVTRVSLTYPLCAHWKYLQRFCTSSKTTLPATTHIPRGVLSGSDPLIRYVQCLKNQARATNFPTVKSNSHMAASALAS